MLCGGLAHVVLMLSTCGAEGKIHYDIRMTGDELCKHITQLLLELGKGFSFCGRQVELVVSGTSYRIDMLFYHIRLKCYVVVELKTHAFQPEYVGKLNFYVTAVDKLLKQEEDNPTIGLLICKTKDETKVEWAFNGINDSPTFDNNTLLLQLTVNLIQYHIIKVCLYKNVTETTYNR